jgi:hypothetical protein
MSTCWSPLAARSGSGASARQPLVDTTSCSTSCCQRWRSSAAVTRSTNRSNRCRRARCLTLITDRSRAPRSAGSRAGRASAGSVQPALMSARHAAGPLSQIGGQCRSRAPARRGDPDDCLAAADAVHRVNDGHIASGAAVDHVALPIDAENVVGAGACTSVRRPVGPRRGGPGERLLAASRRCSGGLRRCS